SDNALPVTSGSSTIYVQGTLTKTSPSGGGTTTTAANLRVQPGGVVNVSSGKLTAGSVFDQGTINLGSKTALNLSGFYLQDVGGALNFAFGGAPVTGQFGRLTA